MDLRSFVGRHRDEWERLDQLLERTSQSLQGLTAEEVRELGLLHRRVSGHLARARALAPESRVIAFLNDLVVRSHNRVYRAPKRPWGRRLRGLLTEVPAVLRRNYGALSASVLFFFTGTIAGAIGTVVDERVAALVLGGSFIEKLRKGEYWIEQTFGVVPTSVISAGITTNNISVSLALFATGLTGLFGAWILFINGVMLGSVLMLTVHYEVSDRFLPFVLTHGVTEISAILVAGAAGFMIFDGWLHPGDRTRAAGMRAGARDGLLLMIAVVIALLVAGPVESYISPVEALAPALRVGFGLALGVIFWGWLLLTGRQSRPRRLIST